MQIIKRTSDVFEIKHTGNIDRQLAYSNSAIGTKDAFTEMVTAIRRAEDGEQGKLLKTSGSANRLAIRRGITEKLNQLSREQVQRFIDGEDLDLLVRENQ